MKSSDRSAIRRAQVFGISLTEMMLILLFLMFLAAKSSGSVTDVCRAELDACKKRSAELERQQEQAKKEIAALKNENDKLRQWVRTLLIALNEKPLAVDDPNFIFDAEGKIARVRAGVGRPNCLVSGEGTLLLSLLMEDGYVTASRLWGEKDDGAVAALPAVQDLIRRGRISFPLFIERAASISGAHKDCVFHVRIVDKTTTKETFKPQLLQIESHFRRRLS